MNLKKETNSLSELRSDEISNIKNEAIEDASMRFPGKAVRQRALLRDKRRMKKTEKKNIKKNKKNSKKHKHKTKNRKTKKNVKHSRKLNKLN